MCSGPGEHGWCDPAGPWQTELLCHWERWREEWRIFSDVITRVDSLLQSSPVMPNQGSGSPMIPGEIPGGTTNIK